MELKKNKFFPETKLMLQSIPFCLEEESFALKGGSAINFFFRDMPRLSVDIDLTYLPIEPRKESLENIESALKRIAQNIEEKLPGVNVQEGKIKNPDMINKLFVSNSETQIKIEPNFVIRGTAFPTEEHALSSKAQEVFELFVEARTEKIRIVLEGLRGDVPISEVCRKEGIAASVYYKWSKEFLEAGKNGLTRSIMRDATSVEVKVLKNENADLKRAVADLTLELVKYKKSLGM